MASPALDTSRASALDDRLVDFLARYENRITLRNPGSVSSEEFDEWVEMRQANHRIVAKELSGFSKDELMNFIKVYLGLEDPDNIAGRQSGCRLAGYGSARSENEPIATNVIPGIVWTPGSREHYRQLQEYEIESLQSTMRLSRPEPAKKLVADAEGASEAEHAEEDLPRPDVDTPIPLTVHSCVDKELPGKVKIRRVAYDPENQTGFGRRADGSPKMEDDGLSLERMNLPKEARDAYADFEKVMARVIEKKLDFRMVMGFVEGFVEANFPKEIAAAREKENDRRIREYLESREEQP